MVDQEKIEAVILEKIQYAINRPEMLGGYKIVEILILELAEVLFFVRGVENAADEIKILHGNWLHYWTRQSKHPVVQTLHNRMKHEEFRKAIKTVMQDFYRRITEET